MDSIDRKIVFQLEKNARISDIKLAELTRKSKDSVRYRIKKLEEAGVITAYRTWIDFTKLGFRTATFYLQTKQIAKRLNTLHSQIQRDPQAYWLGLAHGQWNVGITFFIKTNEDILRIKETLQERYGDIIIDIDIVFLTSLGVQEKKFLQPAITGLVFSAERTTQEPLDEISKKILAELYAYARKPLAQIAHRLGESIDKIKLRVKQLQDKGIIIRYSARIDYHQLGYEYYKTHVYLKNKKALQKLYSYIETTTDMINVVSQIAPWDLEIVHFNKNFQEYTASVAKFTQAFEDDIEKTGFAAMHTDIIYPCDEIIKL